jgi:hypothetical protein
MRLRLARFLDGKSDSYKKKLSETLQKGEVPAEVKAAVEI